jgi:prophage regulatory protein
LTFKRSQIHHEVINRSMEVLAKTYLEMCVRMRESFEVDEMRSGMRHKVLHEELLWLPAVIKRVGLRKTAIDEKIRRAEFPKPVAIGVRARAWRASDINAWIAERATPDRLAD